MALNDKYGSKVASLFVASKYRKINKFDLTVNGGTNSQITLLGEYEGIDDISQYARGFKAAMVSKIQTSDFIEIMGLKKIVSDNLKNDVWYGFGHLFWHVCVRVCGKVLAFYCHDVGMCLA